MKLNITMTVPSMLPAAAWPLPVSLPATAAPSALLVERIPSELVRALPTAAALVPAPREHQVRAQAELGKATLVRMGGNDGTTGFKGSNITISGKRYTDGGSGVPPRGRPV
ncbi:hypothetical protein Aca07nite_09140 [Actinoplanes capillaceus]|uniref:Uncharacterized protein n=1 Tax=Actinoplanes campanulatus TaxID=113559 RepID=A0ABQ3W9B8_9ACTN|nr:hypothetical protein [Actinoplanes capillaceus]GID43639.1 hypothetical protein Aca07nite_09140 [Actinoplanes capillaceus]